MKLRAAVLALILAAVAGGTSLRRTSALQTASPSSSTSVALLITLGEKATGPERWDGSAQISGGRLLATEGRHFSSEDAVTGAGTWRAVARRDEVAPYADIHYTEMRPGARPDVLFHPVGVYLTIEPGTSTRVAVETAQGKFDFPLSDTTATRPLSFLDGRASVVRVPVTEKITTGEFEDDEPAIASLSNGSIAIAWVAYKDRADRILLRTRANGSWSRAEQITTVPGDIFRCSLVTDSAGSLWVFWSERENQRWHIWARQKQGQTWQAPQRVSGEGSNTFHRAAATSGGQVFVVWQSFRKGQSDIFLRMLAGGKWSEEIRVSESPANDWEPAVAAGPQDAAYIAWDSYDKGNYDIQFRSFKEGRLSPVQFVTTSPRFEAHASVAVDSQSRPWVAWDESGVNWGKDQGFLIPAPLSVPLHKERTVRIALGEGGKWTEPARAGALPLAFRENSEHPQILFDGKGTLRMLFRHWTRRNSRAIGSPQVWENYLMHLDGDHWVVPRPLSNSGGSIEKHTALTRDSLGNGWAAWMTDGRPFSTMIPQNADIYVSRLETIEAAPPATQSFGPLASSSEEAIPVHGTESEDVRAIRAYSISSGGKQFRIFRGDMHRHTDVSQDFKYDGSLIEVYRYGLDAAGFDYIAPTDHQTGFDQEFTWWQNQKLVDLFLIPGSFTPLFAYERSLRFPNGHRNIVFAHRGVRTFPIPANEASGEVGAARLFEHLRQNRGISMPHSSATAQGTDWRDNDPEIEPLMEIYQGYRTSYEYEGAPRAASRLNQHIQKSGWQPEGFLWNALAKGYKLGVQASSDHWSTHISYACLLSENSTREGLFDAIRRRHAYAATDNIILDFRARSQGASYIMGDSFSSQSPPQLSVRVFGTGAIKQIDLIKNQSFIYTVRPATKQANFEFTDQTFGKGENYYYVRVLQEDGQLAWSSPIWIRKN